MVFSKLAQAVDMSLDVSSHEQKVAQKSIVYFQLLNKKLESFNTHLDILYNPLKSNENVSEKSVIDHRSALRRFHDKVQENFEELKKIAIYCLQNFNYFSSDTKINELIRTFNDSFNDVEDGLDVLLDALNNWQDKEFRNHIIQNMENVKKQIKELEDLVEERIIDYINTNIFAKNWVDNLDEDLKMSIKEREPYVKQLHKEREEALKQTLRM
jgi:hypothetical protein